MKPSRAALLFCALAACGDPEPVDPGPPRDAGTATARDAGASEPDAGTPDAGERDGGARFPNATPLEIDGPVADGVIDPAGDLDDYVVEATAGSFLLIEATSPDYFRCNTVIQLFDADENLVAENDDAGLFEPRSAIVHRVAVSGTYLVRVQDWSSWSPESEMPLGDANRIYDVRVRTFAGAEPGYGVATETGDDAASARPVELDAFGRAFVAGTFDHAGDVDVFLVDLDVGNTHTVVRVQPVGPNGNGSTSAGLRITATSTDGVTILGRRALDELLGMRPPIRRPQYLLWIEAEQAVGANDFYVLETEPFDWTGLDEPNADDNDTIATAPPLPVTGALNSTNLEGTLDAGDVDYFSVDASANRRVRAQCYARVIGSGLLDFDLRLVAADGTVLASGTETATEWPSLEATVTTDQPMYIRMASARQAPDNPTAFYQCYIRR